MEMPAPVANARLTFGMYEVDLQSGELWKAGFRIKLQSQPFKVLATLLERPGQVVTREELQLKLWGKDTIVDFDHSLGTAINKIREALGDSAENPRFIETLARRGYRFIAPVGYIPDEDAEPFPILEAPVHAHHHHRAYTEPPRVAEAHATESAAPSVPLEVPRMEAAPGRRAATLLWAAAGMAVLAACVAGYGLGISRSPVSPPHIVQITHNGHLAPSVESMENLAAVATDGVRLFAATIEGGRYQLSAVSLSGGGAVVPLNIPHEIASPALGDISPDGSRLLLWDHLSPESEQPLWVVPTIGGSALRVGNVLAHDATWMPDGKSILYANGNGLYLTQLDSNSPQLFASLPGRAFWLRWSPSGKLLRVTVIDPIAHTLSLWQMDSKRRIPQPILSGFSHPAQECCGVWTADERSYVFQSGSGANTDLWRLAGDSLRGPVRLTDGPLHFQSPVAARSGSRIFFLGVDAQSELETLNGNNDLVPERGFLSTAVRVDYSRDGQWVAWTDSSGQLWRARADGTEKLEVTPDTIDVFLAHWSPDGSRLAIMAREPGKAWQIYLTGANGGELQPLLRDGRNAADGKSLVFGRVNDVMGKENAARTLHILHLDSGQLDQVPDSDGLFSPRWSPDGRYIAALTLDQRQVRLFDMATHTWTRLAVPSGADPVWTSDSRALFLHASLDPAQPIERVSIPDGKVTEVVRLAESRENDAVDYVFGGLTLDNRPLIRARVFTGNVYSLDLK
jgi:Tol biopolymer transport system component/DNA-binding winged helix-turn-helix (wHTH) protein